jgi:hypothetical protein
MVSERLAALRARLDLFNQSLAEKALPEERKKMVGRLALTRKAEAARENKQAPKTRGGGKAGKTGKTKN